MTPFAILGASKTGTSTAVAVANSHPAVFCLFEGDFSQSPDNHRNAEFIALLPNAAQLWGSRQTFATSLKQIGDGLASRGWMYERVGTKIPGIRPDILPHLGNMPVLFMVRDIRLWAVKNRVLRDVMAARTATNIVPFLTTYVRYFLDSFLIEQCLRLPLDRVLSTDLTVLPRAMAELLDLTQDGFEQWWQKSLVWKTTTPKNYSSWIEGHTSAFLPPLLTDTNSQLAAHPLWDALLPIFDKYFLAPDKHYARNEVLRDQHALDEIARTQTMTLEEGFARFESFKILNLSKRPDGKLRIEATDRVTEAEIEAAADRWRPEQA